VLARVGAVFPGLDGVDEDLGFFAAEVLDPWIDELPGGVGVEGREGKVVRELVFFEVRKGYGVERVEERRARVDGLVLDGIPDGAPSQLEDLCSIRVLVVFNRVEVPDEALSAIVACWHPARSRLAHFHPQHCPALLVRGQGGAVYLHSTRSLRLVRRAHFVQPKHLARRVIQLVMVDLERRKRGVEGQLNIRRPGRKLEARHGCCNGDGV